MVKHPSIQYFYCGAMGREPPSSVFLAAPKRFPESAGPSKLTIRKLQLRFATSSTASSRCDPAPPEDVSSIMIDENMVSVAGAHHRASEEELRRMIRDAGFVLKQRDTLYRTYFLN